VNRVPLEDLLKLLRERGLTIGITEQLKVGRLLAADISWTRERLKWSLRSILARNAEERRIFDAVFDAQFPDTAAACIGSSPAATGRRTRAAANGQQPPVAAGLPARTPASNEHVLALMCRRLQRAWRAALDFLRLTLRPSHNMFRHRLVRSILIDLCIIAAVAAVVFLLSRRTVEQRREPDRSIYRLPLANTTPTSTATATPDRLGPGRNDTPSLAASYASPQPKKTSIRSGNQSKETTATTATGAPSPSRSPGGYPPRTVVLAPQAIARPSIHEHSNAALWLAIFGTLIGLGLLIQSGVDGIRARVRRSRSYPGPWLYQPKPARSYSLFRPEQIDTAARALQDMCRAELGTVIDLEATVLATSNRAGYPTVVHRTGSSAYQVLVLRDEEFREAPWQDLIDELLDSIEATGLQLARYSFASSPNIIRPERERSRVLPLASLLNDNYDATILIGTGEAAIDPMTGEPEQWLEDLKSLTRPCWLNPNPYAFWSVGAHEIATIVPEVLATTSSLFRGYDTVEEQSRPYSPLISIRPASAEGMYALRAYLGPLGFLWLAALAVAPSPNVAIAHWISPRVVPHVGEADRLRLLALPWLRTGQWPRGLRRMLLRYLAQRNVGLADQLRDALIHDLQAQPPPEGSLAYKRYKLYLAGLNAEGGAPDALVELQLHAREIDGGVPEHWALEPDPSASEEFTEASPTSEEALVAWMRVFRDSPVHAALCGIPRSLMGPCCDVRQLKRWWERLLVIDAAAMLISIVSGSIVNPKLTFSVISALLALSVISGGMQATFAATVYGGGVSTIREIYLFAGTPILRHQWGRVTLTIGALPLGTRIGYDSISWRCISNAVLALPTRRAGC